MFAVVAQQPFGELLAVAQRAGPLRLGGGRGGLHDPGGLAHVLGGVSVGGKGAVLCRSISLFFLRLCKRERAVRGAINQK